MPTAKKDPNKKTTSKVTSQASEKIAEEKVSTPALNISNPLLSFKKLKVRKSWLLIAVIILILVGIAFFKKGWFIAATVNGTPITNFALQKQLNDTYRTQTLTQLINQQIILDEGKKNNIVVTDEDVNNKIKSIETNVGGPQVLDSLLAQQGQTRATLLDQVKTQLIIEKLYANEASVSATEIDQFILQNKDQMQSSDSATQRKEAQDAITQQKISQIFNQKFAQLKQQANIKTY